MNDLTGISREVSRVTLIAHQSLSGKIIEIFTSLGVRALFTENSRCVRQKVNNSFLGIPGLGVEFSDVATEIFRVTVPLAAVDAVLCRLIKELELHIPGRGAVFAQDITEITLMDASKIKCEEVEDPGMLKDLSLITGIQSKSGSGANLFRVALKLGVGVPVVSLGIGTGIRDRLGLLRITISPEKELVYLMVPAHDADGLQRLLIEEGHLDRPGGGFLYQTPIRAGIVDPLIRIGRQEHAASIEQIIAAIDDLKKGTAWRKRFLGMEANYDNSGQPVYTHREIGFLCHEGEGDAFVHAAMQAGAEGATIARLRASYLSGEKKGHSVPCEYGILCVASPLEQPVLAALSEVASRREDNEWVLQSQRACSVFSHKRG